MFNDHILFSNNLNDAANQLRNIQLQKLEEEKYKQRSIKLQEKINILEKNLNYLMEKEDGGIVLGRMERNVLGSVYDTPGSPLTYADRERHKEWWNSLSKEEKDRLLKEWKAAQPTYAPASGGGEYLFPGSIPREFLNPNVPYVTQQPGRMTGPYGR